MKQILIADDYPGFLKSTNAVLRGNYAVLTAKNGKEAIRKAKTNHIDLLMIDYRLPDIDGDELLLQLRKIHPDIPVLFVTGYPSYELEKKVMSQEYGAYRFLTKPLAPDNMLSILEECFSQSAEVSWKQFARKKKTANPKTKKPLSRKKRRHEILKLIESEDKKWTLGRLSRKYNCSEPQIHRDITALRELDYNIHASQKGYFIPKDEKELPTGG